jgi:hypothetical protein
MREIIFLALQTLHHSLKRAFSPEIPLDKRIVHRRDGNSRGQRKEYEEQNKLWASENAPLLFAALSVRRLSPDLSNRDQHAVPHALSVEIAFGA